MKRANRLEDIRPRSLLLGMVYSEEMEPKRGQEYRDRVRCDALEKIGHKVSSIFIKRYSCVTLYLFLVLGKP